MAKQEKLGFHKSYGYASEEDIKKIMSMGECPERKALIKKIEKLNKSKGKTK